MGRGCEVKFSEDIAMTHPKGGWRKKLAIALGSPAMRLG